MPLRSKPLYALYNPKTAKRHLERRWGRPSRHTPSGLAAIQQPAPTAYGMRLAGPPQSSRYMSGCSFASHPHPPPPQILKFSSFGFIFTSHLQRRSSQRNLISASARLYIPHLSLLIRRSSSCCGDPPRLASLSRFLCSPPRPRLIPPAANEANELNHHG